MARTGFVYHPAYLDHDMGLGHPESPQRLRAIMVRLESTGLLTSLVRIEPAPVQEPRQGIVAGKSLRAKLPAPMGSMQRL